jgi:hypothetical protein
MAQRGGHLTDLVAGVDRHGQGQVPFGKRFEGGDHSLQRQRCGTVEADQ